MTFVLISLAVLLGLALVTRIPLGIIILGVGYTGFAVIHPKGMDAANIIAGQQIVQLSLDFQFSVLPLFILMGEFVTRAGLADDMYEAAYKWMGNQRGGLAMATVAACGGFAAISGSSAASAATMARVSIPPMRKFGYADSFSAGTVAAGGTMGILIPPSSALIIYGLLTETSIAKLFMAGIVPGLLTIGLYILTIKILTALKPELGPPGEKSGWGEKIRSLKGVWGVLALFILMLGGIFSGLFTTTEAGGVGALGALCFAIFRGRMTWKTFFDSLTGAARTSAMIFMLVFSAMIMNQFINLSGLPGDVLDLVNSLSASPMHIVLMLLAFYLVLGMFLDGFAMIFLTVPIVAPVIVGLDLDLIWWGIVMVMIVEISQITPPVGLNVYILRSILPDVPLVQIFKGIIPYFLADIVRLSIVVAFPAAVLFLPDIMG